MSSIGLPTRVPCGLLPKLTHGSTVFRCFLRSSERPTSFRHTQSLFPVSARAVYSRGMWASYSETESLAVKLEPALVLGLSSNTHPINTLSCQGSLVQ